MTPGRERLIVVLALLATGGTTVLAATQTFASLRVPGIAAPVVVRGQQVAPALAPLGLVVLAVAGALTIASTAVRVVLGAVLLLAGAGVVALALPSVLDPGAGAGGAIATATGLAGVVVAAGSAGTPWPVVAVIAGVAAAALGGVIVARARRWSTGGRRFSRTPAPAPRAAPADPIAEWDALTRGADPTDPD